MDKADQQKDGNLETTKNVSSQPIYSDVTTPRDVATRAVVLGDKPQPDNPCVESSRSVLDTHQVS